MYLFFYTSILVPFSPKAKVAPVVQERLSDINFQSNFPEVTYPNFQVYGLEQFQTPTLNQHIDTIRLTNAAASVLESDDFESELQQGRKESPGEGTERVKNTTQRFRHRICLYVYIYI